MLKTFISAERLTKTAERYQMLSYKLEGWRGELSTGNAKLAEANSGAYADAFNDGSTVFMNSILHGFMEKTDCMIRALEESRTRVKALLARREDFVNILETGEDPFTSEEYASCALGPEDILYFDDEFCREEAAFSGLIKDNTEIVETESIKQEKDIAELEDYIARLKTIDLNVTLYTDNIRECAKRQKRVRTLWDSLEAYGQGVKEFNEYVSSQFSVYLSLLARNKSRVRTLSYDCDPEKKDMLYTALLRKEGAGLEDIKTAENVCGISKQEFYEKWHQMDGANRYFVSNNLQGNYATSFGMKPKLISNDSLKVAACLHAGLLGNDDPENAGSRYNEMYSAIRGAGLGYMSRMAQAAQKALEENNINRDALTKLSSIYAEKSKFRLKC